MKVSVIIPVYNAADYLKESLDGILNQSLSDIEVICVDDGSKDNSLEILNEIAASDSRVKVYHQENRGGGAARNVALTHASGEYIYFMDADDKLKDGALEECYEIAEAKNLHFIIFQAINYAEDTGEYFESRDYSMYELSEFVGDSVFSYKDLGDMVFKMSVTPWCKFYNHEFVKASKAQFAEGLIFHDNIFFYDSLFYAKRIYFLNKFLYIRRRHSASSTGAGDERYINYITISDMIWQIFFKHGVFDEYKEMLCTKKFGSMNYWFKNIQEEYKGQYFAEMKKDLERIASDDEFFHYIADDLVDWPKVIFESCLECETAEEYELMIKNYELEIDNRHLKELINWPVRDLVFSKIKR
ncbi:glycosyltransferase family 2 protein [Methanobrevibacter sp.]|uniref:glycosyltransferase family 2 protein n=1 Tax=Methanobrevibacter sp. TaxID=66852 RepID=UPI00388DAC4A